MAVAADAEHEEHALLNNGLEEEPPEPEDDHQMGEGEEEHAAPEAPNAARPGGIINLALGKSKIKKRIDDLVRNRNDIKKAQQEASKALKAEKRKERRLRVKAEKLDNNDLMEVFRLRQEAEKKRAAAKAAAKAKAKAQP